MEVKALVPRVFYEKVIQGALVGGRVDVLLYFEDQVAMRFNQPPRLQPSPLLSAAIGNSKACIHYCLDKHWEKLQGHEAVCDLGKSASLDFFDFVRSSACPDFTQRFIIQMTFTSMANERFHVAKEAFEKSNTVKDFLQSQWVRTELFKVAVDSANISLAQFLMEIFPNDMDFVKEVPNAIVRVFTSLTDVMDAQIDDKLISRLKAMMSWLMEKGFQFSSPFRRSMHREIQKTLIYDFMDSIGWHYTMKDYRGMFRQLILSVDLPYRFSSLDDSSAEQVLESLASKEGQYKLTPFQLHFGDDMWTDFKMQDFFDALEKSTQVKVAEVKEVMKRFASKGLLVNDVVLWQILQRTFGLYNLIYLKRNSYGRYLHAAQVIIFMVRKEILDAALEYLEPGAKKNRSLCWILMGIPSPELCAWLYQNGFTFTPRFLFMLKKRAGKHRCQAKFFNLYRLLVHLGVVPDNNISLETSSPVMEKFLSTV